jgi:acid phosphatase
MMRCFLIALTLIVNISVAEPLPRPDHIVIVIEENHAFQQIIGNKDAPYINALAQRGVLFTKSFGVTHPSQPNYIALFSGSTHDVTNDDCLTELTGDNLASILQIKGFSFTIFSELLPQPGFLGCADGAYKRKHNPLSNWKSLVAFNQPFSAFPQDFAKLPTVSLVVPDQLNDMHDGTIAQADTWLSQNIEQYAKWSLSHNSLLIVTWDEDNGKSDNNIATIFVGSLVKPGLTAQPINHYSLLHTFSDMYGLPYLGYSVDQKTIGGIWNTSEPTH